jgi:hypothetical protein
LEGQRIERKLSAIFAADVEGYSRSMGRDEVSTLRTLTAYRVIIDRLIASYRGRIFNTAGDSALADFASVGIIPLPLGLRSRYPLANGVPAPKRPMPSTGDPGRPKSGSQRTLRWREPDSNHQYRGTRIRF